MAFSDQPWTSSAWCALVSAALVVCYLAHALLKKSPLMARFFLGLQATKKSLATADGWKNAK